MRFHLAATVVAALAQLAAWPVYVLAAALTTRRTVKECPDE